MQRDSQNKQLRSFGLTVGATFALIGLWPAVYHAVNPRWWAVVVAVLLVLPALVFPTSLFWIHKGWMAVGAGLGWVNTRVILGIVFYVIVTPIGLVRRWLGKDPMGRELQPELESYRVVRKPRPATHLTKQY